MNHLPELPTTINYRSVTMTNTDPTTGIAYGVISLNSLNPDVAQELMYGPQAEDQTYRRAVKELRKELEREADHLEWSTLEDMCVDSPCEPGMEALLVQSAYERLGYANRDDYIETLLERHEDSIEIEEPQIEGIYEGVTYSIDWLGGAPLVFVLDGPRGTPNAWCAPTVPGAADLDAGFTEDPEGCCYVVPKGWLAEDMAERPDEDSRLDERVPAGWMEG